MLQGPGPLKGINRAILRLYIAFRFSNLWEFCFIYHNREGFVLLSKHIFPIFTKMIGRWIPGHQCISMCKFKVTERA